MANLTRRDPAREVLSLRQAMDRLFDEAFLRPLTPGDWLPGVAGPALDVCETETDVIVTATVPGVKPEALKITLTGDTLQLSAEQTSEAERKDATYHVRERRAGAFSRAISLPVPVNADKVQAEFENGVLTVTLPKAESAKPKAITVKARR